MTTKGLFSTLLLTFCAFAGFASLGNNYNMEDPFSGVSNVKESVNQDTSLVDSFLEDDGKYTNPEDTLPPIQDRAGDFITDEQVNPFDLDDPPSIEKEVEYDPDSGYYIIREKVGDQDYRPPTYLTLEEYLEYTAKTEQRDYFQQLSKDASVGGGVKDPIDRYRSNIKSSLIDRLFGGTTVDIRPNGNIDLTFGGDFQRVDNPILTERQRKQGGFDFDMAIQMNIVGKIGEKLKLTANYNTQATFDVQNQMKLEYTGFEDEIIQKIEAGNVSLPLRSQLIQGSQSLFGVKTELQFGRLKVAAVVSQKKSRQQQVQVQGGAQIQEFEVAADRYDENRHFLISHYNRDNFNQLQSNLPNINTLFKINKIEVWVTNTQNKSEDVRDVVALMDLGEAENVKPNSDFFLNNPIPPIPPHQDVEMNPLPENRNNPLYERLANNPNARDVDNTVSTLTSSQFRFKQAEDFERVRAVLLKPSEYTVHPDLGYISLNVNLQPDAVLGVAYEYTYNGEVYNVGEFTNDVPADGNVLFVKMLKSTTPRVDLPIWDLMMKNVYAIGAFQVNREDFELDVVYQDPGKGEKRFITEGPFAKCPLITLLNLDNLNAYADPVPDGNFDFVPGITINPKNGRVVFPVLEPFGEYMEDKFEGDAIAEKYVYHQLYDSTVTIARNYPELNRFLLKGSYKSSVSSEISLGAFGIPPGSVTVTAGGRELVEGQDYEIDYNIGRVRVLNEAYIGDGVPINVSYEDNTLFSFQTKTLFGTRLDYELSKDINIGGTFMHLSERPFTQKVNVGDDPISNSIYGLDLNYSKEAPWLTKALDKLPLYQTKEPSNISLTAEGAWLKPGHSKALNSVDGDGDKGGTVFLDDFEGSINSLDLKFSPVNWALASTPNTPLFPEATLINNLDYGKNRAKLAWYRIEADLQNRSANPQDDGIYTTRFFETDIFKNRTSQNGVANLGLQTLDLAFYPSERGPYNFDIEPTATSAGIDIAGQIDGSLNDPETRWGGIQRKISTTDFEQSNIEFIEFWMLSPFHESKGGNGGDLYFNLGSVSEDILKDSKYFYEDGLPTGGDTEGKTETTEWGIVPSLAVLVNNAFTSNQADQVKQDVGLDGLDNEGERTHFADFLNALPSNLATAYNEDPSNDDYLFIRDEEAYGALGDPSATSILDRYKKYNNPQGNSLTPTSNVPSSNTGIPDTEDINDDGNISETEAFYEYKISIRPDNNPGAGEGAMLRSPFVVDTVDNRTDNESMPGRGLWYQFKIPVEEFTKAYGGIQDFRSIRFIRMYMHGFDEEVILRFGSLELVRNQWRTYDRPLNDGIVADPDTQFDVTDISFEENSSRTPFNYVLPPGVSRENSVGAFPNALQNEKSLSLRVCNLADGDARGIFKNLNLDMRRYNKMKMFIHAEALEDTDIQPGQMTAFIRMGSDFVDNYYEYEIPLTMSELPTTGQAVSDADLIWLEDNEFNFPLELFRNAKVERNASGTPGSDEYEITDPEKPNNSIRIKGNPDLGQVKSLMVGVRNADDGSGNLCSEIWVNELRLSGLDERGGMAGLARMDVKLADLGNLSASVNYTGIGWGGLEQRVAQRALEEVTQYDLATNLEVGKFLPKESGVRIPFYAQYSKTVKNPEFDPYALDIKLKENIRNAPNREVRDSIKEQSQDVVAIKSINLTNVRKERTNSKRKPMPYDIENWSATYAWSNTFKRDPIIRSDNVTTHRGSLDYNYSIQSKPLEPFKKLIKSKSKWLGIVKDFNVNPIPNSFGFRNDLNRHRGEIVYRFSELPEKSTYFDKRFTWDRAYNFRWDFTKSLNFNFTANNNAVIDEGQGDWRIQENRDTLRMNLRNFGRTKNYNQNVSLSYTFPTKLIPLIDWTTLKAQYSGNYTWSAAALNVEDLGNVIQNGQNRQVNADLDFVKLYNKVKYLKKINSRPKPKKDNNSKAGSKTPAKPNTPTKGKDDKKKEEREPSIAERILLRPLMSLRKARFSYSQQLNSVVPGYMPQTSVLGMDKEFSDLRPGFAGAGIQRFSAPGWDYVFGLRQPLLNEPIFGSGNGLSDDWWLNRAGSNGWITADPLLNRQVTAGYTNSIDGKITVEPFKDFKIDLSMNRSLSENQSEYYKVQDEFSGEYEHLNRLENGSLSLSFYSMGTMFQKLDSNSVNAAFQAFEANRSVISERLVGYIPGGAVNSDSLYQEGFGGFQQDVLIPAFLAAYTGKDAASYPLSFKRLIPKPNWKISYNGLSKIKAFSKLFASFNISHGYSSKLTINSYRTNYDFSNTTTANINQNTSNYHSRYEIPDIVISEQLAPLIGLDVRFKNDLQVRMEEKPKSST